MNGLYHQTDDVLHNTGYVRQHQQDTFQLANKLTVPNSKDLHCETVQAIINM